MATMADFRTSEKSWWCPGCGDFGVLAGLQKALVELGIEPQQVALASGIGCSGKIGNYINSYNLHVVHGRSLPAAQGIKLANRELTVIAAGGDGDGFAIGMGHYMHALRRNVDITYIVMDNQIYGLTKGQTSPTSDGGFQTKSTPNGNIEKSVNQMQLAIASGCGFVANGFSANQKQLVEIIKRALQFPGFALVNTYSPCVTFNKLNTFDFYKQEIVNLDEDPTYDRSDRFAAMKKLMETNELVTGIIYEDPNPTRYEDKVSGYREQGIVNQSLEVDPVLWAKILGQYK
ncbi:MAG: 2-oxoacid:ferredoxin oxidoreductase beta subunit [Symbiobacteriaceae bacterium]|jgi:2-oxoglutarate ferredoxin oxidoreductase subunit beta|nr:2-oxoacid:ferredoxin oxidoreductase beta subunit [Symbiobacteriaceae bacterium]